MLQLLSKHQLTTAKSHVTHATRIQLRLHAFAESNVQDGSCLPANLICQLFGSAVRFVRGVFTGHVAGGEEVTNEFPWILRAIGVVSYYPANVLQYLAL